MEFLSLSRRHSSARNVPNGEERGETDVFTGYHRLIIWIILMSLTVGEKTWHQWKVRMSYNSNKPVFDEEADESSDIKAAGSWTPPPPPPPPLLVDTAGVFAGTWVVPFCEKKSAQSIPNGLPQGAKELIVTLIGGNERRPNASGRPCFPSETGSAEKKIIVAVVRPLTVRGFPEHWIIFHLVCNTIAWRFDGWNVSKHPILQSSGQGVRVSFRVRLSRDFSRLPQKESLLAGYKHPRTQNSTT